MLQWTKDVEGGSGASGASSSSAAAAMTTTGVAVGASGKNTVSSSPLSAAAEDVLVLVWPPGDIARVPRGTSAGSLVASRRPLREATHARATSRALPPATATIFSPPLSASSSPLPPPPPPVINVNNRLVPPGTLLADGDFVVLDGGLLENL